MITTWTDLCSSLAEPTERNSVPRYKVEKEKYTDV